MNPWPTVVSTLLGVLITSGIGIYNLYIQRQTISLESERTHSRAIEQSRREVQEERARRARDVRIECYGRFLAIGTEAAHRISMLHVQRGTPDNYLPKDEADQALACWRKLGAILGEIRIIGSDEVHERSEAYSTAIAVALSNISPESTGADPIAASSQIGIRAGELHKAMRTDVADNM